MVHWCGNTKGKRKACKLDLMNHFGLLPSMLTRQDDIFLKPRLLAADYKNIPSVATKKLYLVHWCGNTKGKRKACKLDLTSHFGLLSSMFRNKDVFFSEAKAAVCRLKNIPSVATKEIIYIVATGAWSIGLATQKG